MQGQIDSAIVYLIFLFVILLFPCPCDAYIDPGTGGIIGSFLSGILFILASLGSFIVIYIVRPIREFLKKSLLSIARRKYIVVITLLSGFVIIALSLMLKSSDKAVRQKGPAVMQFKKTIIVGIDGFDPDIAEFLMGKNRLKNFQRLRDMGTYSRIQTIMPPISPAVWATIATGVNPGEHGICDFIKIDREKYLPYLTVLEQSGSLLRTQFQMPIKAAPFWHILSNKNVPVSIIRWPVTFPAGVLNGDMLSGLGTPDIRGFLNSYLRFTNIKETAPDSEMSRIVPVKVIGRRVTAEFQGPLRNGGLSFTEPFVIEINDENTGILRVQDRTYKIRKGVWSDWIRVRFKQGFGRSTDAVCKVFPQSIEPDFDLFVTSMQFDSANPAFDISYPHDYSKSLSHSIGTFYTLGMPEDAKAVNDRNLSKEAFVEQVDQIRREREAMLFLEYKKLIQKDSGVLAVVFDETDRMNHIFYNKQVKENNDTIQEVGPLIEKIYTDKDRMIGKILDTLPPDVCLIIVSDHGFRRFTRAVNLNTWLFHEGYLVLKKGVTLSEAKTLYRDVDWKKTRAYAAGYCSININLKNREGSGIVPLNKKQELIHELMEKIRLLRDANGEKVTQNVYKREDIYSGQYLSNAGDIIVGFMPPYRIDWSNPAGGFSTSVISDNRREWQADHIVDPSFVDGIFFANFKVKSGKPSVLDIAPTILSQYHIAQPVKGAGKSLLP